MEATIVEVRRLLNEYKQYFLLPLQPKATFLKTKRKKVSCHKLWGIFLELSKAGY